MTGRLLRPDGLSGRIALLLSLALATAHLVIAGSLYLDREAQAGQSLLAAELGRLDRLVAAMLRAGPATRAEILQLAQSETLSLSLSDAPLDMTGLDPVPPDLVRQIRTMPSLAEATGGIAAPAPYTAPRLILSVPIDGSAGDGSRLVAALRLDAAFLPARSPGRLALILGLPFALVLAFGLGFVRRLVLPLQQMASAARAFGHGQRGVRLAEDGPRELRDLARAFNEMQDRLAAAEAERLRMVAAVGHDLRTPLTSLRIRAEMLDEDEAEPIIRTIEDMAVMAETLIAYARGARDAEPIRHFDLRELLERLCDECGCTLIAADPAGMRGQPVALGRALRNLLDNARRYGTDTRVTLTAAKACLTVQIDDDGPGIPPERIETLFRPFERGEASRNPDTGGVGLGLAIARAVIERHGGRISLSNRPEGGLRATVTLPPELPSPAGPGTDAHTGERT